MAKPGLWLHAHHCASCFDVFLEDRFWRHLWCREAWMNREETWVGLLCPSEGPGSGVPPQGKVVFCVVFLACFLVMGMKAPMCWICKALGITPASGKGGNRRLCLAVFPLRLQLHTSHGSHTPEGALPCCLGNVAALCLESSRALRWWAALTEGPFLVPSLNEVPPSREQKGGEREVSARARQDLGPPPYAG